MRQGSGAECISGSFIIPVFCCQRNQISWLTVKISKIYTLISMQHRRNDRGKRCGIRKENS